MKCRLGYYNEDEGESTLLTCKAVDDRTQALGDMDPPEKCTVQTCAKKIAELHPLQINPDLENPCKPAPEENDKIKLKQNEECRLQCASGYREEETPYMKCTPEEDRTSRLGVMDLKTVVCKVQKCTFKSSDIKAPFYDLNDCAVGALSDGSGFELEVSGRTSCTLTCQTGYEKRGLGTYKCLKNGNEDFGKKEEKSLNCIDKCTQELKLKCAQANKQPCRTREDFCRNCLAGFVPRGSQCIPSCDIKQKRKCVAKNRKPCNSKNSACGECISPNYIPESKKKDSRCVLSILDVPIMAEIDGINLDKRQQRIYLQDAFQEVMKDLNLVVGRETNNFEVIDVGNVLLVNVFSPAGGGFGFWKARVKMKFKTSVDRPGWSTETIDKFLMCCRRVKILAIEIRKKFRKSHLIAFTVLRVKNRITQLACDSGPTPPLQPRPVTTVDHGYKTGPSAYLFAGLCSMMIMGDYFS